ncbi:unnamed protein product [Zymoseptoria tritici ST99CH_1A5]|uniref:P450 monooxygenase n=2 Tax=Zymoseptoria tritici TaxID=1047171 RepID=F9XFL7_ZYMTI|nr:putative P450 monooxygenase [Zymoseptoria tritici IPO323]EGP86164.1 putative P450 monooxygenase [Zymoseptoria tritici IPO323]SMY26052.1 unnamed protein product [Zymoseptoria tritici ST99CH_1A5]
MSNTDIILTLLKLGFRILVAGIGLSILTLLYNISPFHPLAKYPGPIHWRATRLFASYHHSTGDLYQHIAAFHDRYGHTVRVAPDELSFTDPEAWAQIYNSRPQLPKSTYHFGELSNDRLPTSMITAHDAEHNRLRRLLGPAFQNSSIAEVEPVLQQYFDLLCKQLTIASREGSQDIGEWFLWALNDVIGHLALDQKWECLEKRRLHPWPSYLLNVLKLSAAVNQFRRWGVTMDMLMPFMSAKSRTDAENFIEIAHDAINERLAKEEDEQKSDTDGSSARPDIVGLITREMKGGDKLTKAEVTSNCVLIVGGGAETTATCLSSTMYHLCSTPRVMNKLREEIRAQFSSSEEITLKAVQEMPYLKATIDEALRMFPVASYICPRITPKGGHIVAGEVIPSGFNVTMGQWAMGRSKHLFDNPNEFRPERWVDSEVQDACGRRVNDILKPFSMGPRDCVGKLLALAEARLVTAKLLWHFDMELDGDHSTWVQDARFYVLWQLRPLKVKLTPIRT